MVDKEVRQFKGHGLGTLLLLQGLHHQILHVLAPYQGVVQLILNPVLLRMTTGLPS